MSWVIVAVGVIVSSAFLYTFIRKAKNLNMSIEMQNLGMFFLPMICFMIYNIIAKVPFSVDYRYLLILFGAAILFSWLGNVFSLKAIKEATNPGYSLIISKSYVVLSTILAVVLLNATITFKDIISIIIIILFSSLIVINKKEKTEGGKNWLVYTFGALFCWAFLAITQTFLISKGVITTQILFYISFFVSCMIGIEMLYKKVKLDLNKQKTIILVFIGISSTIFNLGLTLGYKLAPNPGYINAANAGSIALVTILSKVIFKDELSIKKAIGIIGVLIGLCVLFIK